MEISQKRGILSNLFLILISSFAANFALMYWWWAQIYLYTGSIFSISLFILVLLNPVVLFLVNRNSEEFLIHLEVQKKSFIVPLVIGRGFMIVHLLGLTDITVHRYLYRSIFIMVAMGISLIYALIQKYKYYKKTFDRNIKKMVVAFFVDLVSLTLYFLLLTNIEGLLT